MSQNYESQYWGYIYDQMMAEMAELVESHRRFYLNCLRETSGPVLECACGTGLFFLPLRAAGLDIYGFDISPAMLATLEKKARAQGLAEISGRVSVQEFETFRYDQRFEAIFIATNSFSMLTTQEAQIRALRNIYNHLAPGGRLLLDLRLPGLLELCSAPEKITGTWYTWNHPETGLPIRQRVDGWLDIDQQLMLDRCFIEYEGQQEDFPMTGRWIYPEEFQLLLRLAGFACWKCSSTPEGGPVRAGPESTISYWTAYKYWSEEAGV